MPKGASVCGVDRAWRRQWALIVTATGLCDGTQSSLVACLWTGGGGSEANETNVAMEQTVSQLRGGVVRVQIASAIPVIAGWERTLKATILPKLAPVAVNLRALRTAHTSEGSDPAEVGRLLNLLGDQVRAVATSRTFCRSRSPGATEPAAKRGRRYPRAAGLEPGMPTPLRAREQDAPRADEDHHRRGRREGSVPPAPGEVAEASRTAWPRGWLVGLEVIPHDGRGRVFSEAGW